MSTSERINKPRRLPYWDYSWNGAYFITFCTVDRLPLLGNIEIFGKGVCEHAIFTPSSLGEICIDAIERIRTENSDFHIDSYVVMPNHVHLLAFVHLEEYQKAREKDRRVQLVQRIVARIKSHVTHVGRQEYGIDRVWQVSFHDHIVRNEDDLARIREYIQDNPAKWALDCFYQV